MKLRHFIVALACAALLPRFTVYADAATCTTASMYSYRLWSLSGSVGQTVTVPFTVALKNQNIATVSGIDFRLDWDKTSLAIDHIQAGQLCYGQLCYDNTMPTCDTNGYGCTWGQLPTGHQVTAVPQNIADWAGRGVLMFVDFNSSGNPINSAYLDANGLIVGDDSVVFTATFTLLTDIGQDAPADVWMSNASFSQSSGFTLYASVEDLANGQGRAIVLDDQKPADLPPYAEAGPEQSVKEKTAVTLDGSASCDVNGALATIAWTQTSGPPALLSGADTLTPTFTAPPVSTAGATAVFRLTVTDTGGLSSQDVVVVHIGDVLEGDMDDSGAVDLADVILTLQALAGRTVPSFNLAADVDGDGRASLQDAIYIVRQCALTSN